MCLILFAWQSHPKYPLILVANRDEFHHRPTLQANFWEENQNVLAGRDLQAGGTWLGITRQGRFAAITNYRDPKNIRANAPSRGELTSNFLLTDISPEDYLSNLLKNGMSYNGFNLIVGNRSAIWYSNNIESKLHEIAPGIHGLSNAFLNSAWPKTDKGKLALQDIISTDDFALNDLVCIMLDKSKAPDHLLPSTGVSYDWEKVLSSRYIEAQGYGTTITTTITIDNAGKVQFMEKTHELQQNPAKEAYFEFYLG